MVKQKVKQECALHEENVKKCNKENLAWSAAVWRPEMEKEFEAWESDGCKGPSPITKAYDKYRRALESQRAHCEQCRVKSYRPLIEASQRLYGKELTEAMGLS